MTQIYDAVLVTDNDPKEREWSDYSDRPSALSGVTKTLKTIGIGICIAVGGMYLVGAANNGAAIRANANTQNTAQPAYVGADNIRAIQTTDAELIELQNKLAIKRAEIALERQKEILRAAEAEANETLFNELNDGE